jgi:3-methyladenine DNA glycosylase AlkD
MKTAIQESLFALQDLKYRDFQSKLMPTVPKEKIIGVRVPDLRALARTLRGTDEAAAFLRDLPHTYHEEDDLHAILLGGARDYDRLVKDLDAFLPHVDNWATCDMLRPKLLKKHLPALRGEIDRWLTSSHVYTARFALGLLLSFYLDEAFDPADLDRAAGADREGYYLRMMVAWYFATALAKQYPVALAYLREGHLSPWTHNKAIQKAVESRRLTGDQKGRLRAMKRPARGGSSRTEGREEAQKKK